MFAGSQDTAAPMIKAAARISEYYRSTGRWQWVVGGRIDGWLLDVGFELLASALQAASSAVQPQKRTQNAIKRQCKHIYTLSDSGASCAVRSAHVFVQPAHKKCDEPSQP